MPCPDFILSRFLLIFSLLTSYEAFAVHLRESSRVHVTHLLFLIPGIAPSLNWFSSPLSFMEILQDIPN
jgi:hypothetical protein